MLCNNYKGVPTREKVTSDGESSSARTTEEDEERNDSLVKRRTQRLFSKEKTYMFWHRQFYSKILLEFCPTVGTTKWPPNSLIIEGGSNNLIDATFLELEWRVMKKPEILPT